MRRLIGLLVVGRIDGRQKKNGNANGKVCGKCEIHGVFLDETSDDAADSEPCVMFYRVPD